MEKKYVKLSDLIDNTINIQKVHGFKYKKWNTEERRMEVSDDWAEGYQKKWQVDTDKGTLDLGSGQMGTLLEAVCEFGESSLIDKTFQIKSNGKTGLEIRYFFNHIPEWKLSGNAQSGDGVEQDVEPDEVDLSEIPF